MSKFWRPLVLLILVLPASLSWAGQEQEKNEALNLCLQTVDSDYLEALKESKENGTLTGQKLCLLVESRFNAIDHCRDSARVKRLALEFSDFLKINQGVTVAEAERRIARLKDRWLSSSFMEQFKIRDAIHQIQTCFMSTKPSSEPPMTTSVSR